MTTRTNCPGCGVAVGLPHINGCNAERCSICDGKRINCDCEGHDPTASAWIPPDELLCEGCGTTQPFAEAIAGGWVIWFTDGEFDINEGVCARCQEPPSPSPDVTEVPMMTAEEQRDFFAMELEEYRDVRWSHQPIEEPVYDYIRELVEAEQRASDRVNWQQEGF